MSTTPLIKMANELGVFTQVETAFDFNFFLEEYLLTSIDRLMLAV